MSLAVSSPFKKTLILKIGFLLCTLKAPLWANEISYPEAPKQILRSTPHTRPEARFITLRIPAPRGQITDRDGQPLAQNRVAYILSLRLPQIKSKIENEKKQILKTFIDEKITLAEKVLQKKVTINFDRIWEHWSNRRWLPYQTDLILEENEKQKLENELNPTPLSPGWYLTAFYLRHYPQGESSAHIIGTLGKVAPLSRGPLVGSYKNKEAMLDPLWEDTTGRNGLEKAYDQQLKGKDGLLELMIDEDGSEMQRSIVRKPIPGHNVVSTIDLKWQKFAESLLKKKNHRSAFVMLDIEKGEIPVLASYPLYNPALFAPAIDQATYDKLSKAKDDPLVARAWQGSYPPGSVFKIPVALAALEKNIFNIPWNDNSYNINDEIIRNTTIDCGTEYQIGNKVFHNWSDEAEGPLSIYEALMRSCNTWFYPVGQSTGAPDILSMAQRLGLGQNTGLEKLDENAPKLPLDKKYFPGDVANLSIGQGDVLVSPIQIARMTSAMILRGRPRSFNILKQIQTQNAEVIEAAPPFNWTGLKTINSKLLNIVAEGLYLVVNGDRGTATAAQHPAMEVAGKTGTAQWGPLNNRAYVAWFTGFFPFNKPRYAFAVMIEGDPHQNQSGGGAAAPIAGEFLRKIFPEGVSAPAIKQPEAAPLAQTPANAIPSAPEAPKGLMESSFLSDQDANPNASLQTNPGFEAYTPPTNPSFADNYPNNSPPNPTAPSANPEADAPRSRNQNAKEAPKGFLRRFWDGITR
jgi:penicillin-binding protein 2